MENKDKKSNGQISFKKDKIANLSAKQMESIYAGIDALEAEGGQKNSTQHDFTCTWCAHSVPCTVTIVLKENV
jgi:hypothetical protein